MVVYTTLLKGYAAVGDVATGLRVLTSMRQQRPPVPPDVRSINTFLRGCVRVGDLATAHGVFSQLQSVWQVASTSTYKQASLPVAAATREFARARLPFLFSGSSGSRTTVEEQRAGNPAHRSFFRSALTVGGLGESQVVADDSSNKYMARLLSQGLKLELIEAVLAKVTVAQTGDTRRFLPPCMFWAQVSLPQLKERR